MPDAITTTLAITVGIAFYMEPGDRLGCGGTFTEMNAPWAAVPLEWLYAGYVE